MNQIKGNYQKNEPQIKQKFVLCPEVPKKQIVENNAQITNQTVKGFKGTVGHEVFYDGDQNGKHGVQEKISKILHRELGRVSLVALFIFLIVELQGEMMENFCGFGS